MATSAIETAKQENGSKHFFQSMIEKNKEPSDKDMLKIYDGYNLEWKTIYRKQTVALKNFLSAAVCFLYVDFHSSLYPP